MKFKPKVLVAVFAHPDDEAFGPGGALAHYAKLCDVHVICVTDGGAGKSENPTLAENLATVRKQEFLDSTQLLGVKSVRFLGYPDGTLNNNLYHEVASSVQTELDRLRPDTLLTFDLNGVSGHLDHVAVAMITSYLYERLDYVRTLMYFCLPEAAAGSNRGKYFVFFPPGYPDKQIDLKLDVAPVFETKLKAMRAHLSQRHDSDRIIATQGERLKIENFRILKK